MSEHDLWQVKLSEGCVIDMTPDEIDTAFNAGRISARTSVLPPGDFRWTTLGEAAGLEDDERETEPAPYSIAPYSIAPVAADVAPPPPMFSVDDGIDVDLESAAGLPKKRGVFGKVVAVSVLFGVLVAVGIGGGAYAARPAEFKAKVAGLKERFTHAPAKAAAVAPPPPPVQAAPPPPAPPPPAPPPPAVAHEPAPAAAPAAVATMHASSSSSTSVSALPDAKAKKKPATKKR